MIHSTTMEAPHGFHKAPLFCTWAPPQGIGISMGGATGGDGGDRSPAIES